MAKMNLGQALPPGSAPGRDVAHRPRSERSILIVVAVMLVMTIRVMVTPIDMVPLAPRRCVLGFVAPVVFRFVALVVPRGWDGEAEPLRRSGCRRHYNRGDRD